MTSAVDDTIPPCIVDEQEGLAMVQGFRANVLGQKAVCAISGLGTSWLSLVPSPGLEAIHIVPSVQWSIYPVTAVSEVVPIEDDGRLQSAWKLTWSDTNGLPMLAHFHKCFDARLIAIDPKTSRIRTFVNIDFLNMFHGKTAFLPADVDPKALQHHWNMCCVENMVNMAIREGVPPKRIPPAAGMSVPAVPEETTTSTNLPLIPSTSCSLPSGTAGLNPLTGYTGPADAADDGESARAPAPDPATPMSTEADRSYQRRARSPSLRRSWRFSGLQILDPKMARELIDDGYDVESDDENSDLDAVQPRTWIFSGIVTHDRRWVRELREEGYHVEEVDCSAGEEKRGRPMKRRRAREDEDADSTWKRQRHSEVSPNSYKYY